MTAEFLKLFNSKVKGVFSKSKNQTGCFGGTPLLLAMMITSLRRSKRRWSRPARQAWMLPFGRRTHWWVISYGWYQTHKRMSWLNGSKLAILIYKASKPHKPLDFVTWTCVLSYESRYTFFFIKSRYWKVYDLTRGQQRLGWWAYNSFFAHYESSTQDMS